MRRTGLGLAATALLLAACASTSPTAGLVAATTASPSGAVSSTDATSGGAGVTRPTLSPSWTASPSVTPQRSTTATPTWTSSSPTHRPTAAPTPGSIADVPVALRGKDVTRIPTTAKVVALTFDAGGNAAGVASILATLRAQGVPATFFMTGHWVDVFPTQAKQVAAAGERIGNHTVTHPHMNTLSDTAIRAEVNGARTRILTTTGREPRPLFRFPYGERSAHTIALLNSMGYVCVSWTVDSLGWMGTENGGTAAKVTARVLAAATPGEIVLMHVGSNPDDHTTFDADALPGIIAGLRARGYSFVTLNALLT